MKSVEANRKTTANELVELDYMVVEQNVCVQVVNLSNPVIWIDAYGNVHKSNVPFQELTWTVQTK